MRGNNAGLGLFVLRVVIGIIFLNHGLGKLLGPPFAGTGIGQFEGLLASLHFPAPTALAWAGAFLETLGGLALIIGAGVSVAALLLGIEMVIAVLKVHLSHGFDVFHYGDAMARGYEYNLALLGGLAALVLGGPGILAVQLKPKG